MNEKGEGKHLVLLRNTFANLGDIAMMHSELSMFADAFPGSRMTVLSDERVLESEFAQVTWADGDVVLSSPVSHSNRTRVREGLVSSRGSPLARIAGRLVYRASDVYRRIAARRFLNATRNWVSGSVASRLPQRERALFETLRSADVVVSGGGLLATVPEIALPRRVVLQCLRMLGVPYVLHGLSLTSTWDDETYSGASFVQVRDESHSVEMARMAGVPAHRLSAALDPAYHLTPAGRAEVDSTLAALGLDDRSFIAVNLRSGETSERPPVEAALAKWIERVTRAKGSPGVLLFGMQQYHGNHDSQVLESFRRKLAGADPVVVWEMPPSPQVLRGVLARARVVVSCRYHGALFALAENVPTAGVIVREDYRVKMNGLFRHFEVPGLCVSASGLEQALESLTIDERASEVAAGLKKRNVELASLGDPSLDHIRALLCHD